MPGEINVNKYAQEIMAEIFEKYPPTETESGEARLSQIFLRMAATAAAVAIAKYHREYRGDE